MLSAAIVADIMRTEMSSERNCADSLHELFDRNKQIQQMKKESELENRMNAERQANYSSVFSLSSSDTDEQIDCRRRSTYLYELESINEEERGNQNLFTAPVIFPSFAWKQRWDIWLSICILWTAVEIPLQASFHGLQFQFLTMVEYFFVLCFSLDIYFNAKTVYIEKREYITNIKQIRTNYFKTWLFFDVVSAFPLAEIAEILDYSSATVGILKWIHVIRVGRVLRNISNISAWSHLRAFFVLLAILIIIAHWMACMFHELSYFQEDESWIAVLNMSDATDIERYTASMYFAMTTITTIGYGDVHAVSFVERVFAIFMVFIAANVYAILLALMSLIIGKVYHGNVEHNLHLDKCQTSSLSLKLHADFEQKLLEFIEFAHEQINDTCISYLMNMEMPNSMKYEIVHAILKPLLTKINGKQFSPFTFCSDAALLYIAENLNVYVSLPHEYIFHVGDFNFLKIFILKTGIIRIYHQKGNKEICRLKFSGEYFGEMPLLCSEICRASTIAAMSHSFVVCYSISYLCFQDLQLYDDNLYELFRTIARARIRKSHPYKDCKLVHNICLRKQMNIQPSSMQAHTGKNVLNERRISKSAQLISILPSMDGKKNINIPIPTIIQNNDIAMVETETETDTEIELETETEPSEIDTY